VLHHPWRDASSSTLVPCGVWHNSGLGVWWEEREREREREVQSWHPKSTSTLSLDQCFWGANFGIFSTWKKMILTHTYAWKKKLTLICQILKFEKQLPNFYNRSWQQVAKIWNDFLNLAKSSCRRLPVWLYHRIERKKTPLFAHLCQI